MTQENKYAMWWPIPNPFPDLHGTMLGLYCHGCGNASYAPFMWWLESPAKGLLTNPYKVLCDEGLLANPYKVLCDACLHKRLHT